MRLKKHQTTSSDIRRLPKMGIFFKDTVLPLFEKKSQGILKILF